MNKAKAKAIADKDLEFYRQLSYKEIGAKIGAVEHFERISEQGEPYQIEFDCFYDDHKSGNIRVVGIISYSGWTDFFPVTRGFILAPDGEFVDE